MKPLSDNIEAFIKSLLGENQDQVDVQRNELASYFRCAPSQITYVLSTRFTLDHGYLIQSRRGGGGYIRIVRLRNSTPNLLAFIDDRIQGSLSIQDCQALIQQMEEKGIISEREAGLIRAATSAPAINLPVAMKDALRASVFRAIIVQLARY